MKLTVIKKTLTILMFMGCFYELKAQQLLQIRPGDSSWDNAGKYLNLDSSHHTLLLKPPVNYGRWPSSAKSSDFFVDSQPYSDRMAVVVFGGKSNMPVVNLKGYSSMPIMPIDADAATAVKLRQDF